MRLQREAYILSFGLLLGGSFLLGAVLIKSGETIAPPPLTYSNPLPVLEPKSAPPGGSVRVVSDRCNNTGHDLAVEATVFWQSSDGLHLRPVISSTTGQPIGRVPSIIPAGCRNNFVGTLAIPLDLPLGEWRLRGQVCYGGISLDKPTTCTGWTTEVFKIHGEAVH